MICNKLDDIHECIAAIKKNQVSVALEKFNLGINDDKIEYILIKSYDGSLSNFEKVLSFGHGLIERNLPYSYVRASVIYDCLFNEMKREGHLYSHTIFILAYNVKDIMNRSNYYSECSAECQGKFSAIKEAIPEVVIKLIWEPNVYIYNEAYSKYLFISNDKKKAIDSIIEAKQDEGDVFKCEYIKETNEFSICDNSCNKYLFVSNDQIDSDNVVEASDKPENKESTHFQFIFPPKFELEKQPGIFYIYNRSYKKYLFVSNDEINGNNIVEAHKNKNEERNLFNFLKSPP